MCLVISRLFLFLLLLCDWTWDPYLGNNPLSHPLSSTETCCDSLKTAETILSVCLEQPDFTCFSHACPVQADLDRSLLALLSPSSAVANIELLYVFMSLQHEPTRRF